MKLDWKQPLMKYAAAAKCLSFRPNYTVLSNCKQLHTAIFAATDRRWKEALCCMISCYRFPGDFCCAVLTYMIFDRPRSRARTLRARMKPSRPMAQILPAWRGKGSWTQWLAEMMRSEELLGKRWKTWKGYEKKILFKIVQKGSSECYVYTRRVFPCVFPCFARLQGPRCWLEVIQILARRSKNNPVSCLYAWGAFCNVDW